MHVLDFKDEVGSPDYDCGDTKHSIPGDVTVNGKHISNQLFMVYNTISISLPSIKLWQRQACRSTWKPA